MRLCAISCDILGADDSTSWRWSSDWDAFIAAASVGTGDERARAHLRRADVAPLAERLTREDLVVLDAASSIPELHQGGGITICFPLRRGDVLVGLQTAGYRARVTVPTEVEERTIQGLVHLATMALSNAYLVEELECASRVKDEFVATMSHELRTPLNVIIGYAEMLADDLVQPEHTQMLAQIRRATVDLLELVQTTLDLNCIAAGADRPVLTAVRIVDVWNELRADFAAIQHGPVALRLDAPPDAMVRTDRRKLNHIMRNLIGNALKFTEAGDVLVSVGLGLHLVRTLVEQLGGAVSVQSTLGVGSTFAVTLPWERDHHGSEAPLRGATDEARAGAA